MIDFKRDRTEVLCLCDSDGIMRSRSVTIHADAAPAVRNFYPRIVWAIIILGSAYGTYATYDPEPSECPRGEARVTTWKRGANGRPYQDTIACQTMTDAKVHYFVRNADGKIVRDGTR